MKNKLLCLVFATNALGISAQTTENVSVGANYVHQTFYRLSDGSTQSSAHSDWHIAFSVLGAQDAALFINEGASLSGSRVKLYSTGISDFSTSIDTNSTPLVNELTNQEISWNYGAFNENRLSSDPFDYGWGSYNLSSHQVEGSEVYVLKLPNGDLKKIKIDSLSSGSYHFRYADLNGNNLQTKSIAKANFSGQTLAYYSLTTHNTLAAVELSGGWDLLFTRYEELIPDGQGGFMPYNVTGVLSNQGVEVAEANGVNVGNVNYQTYLDSLNSEPLYTIGSDWKSYDFSNGWSVSSNRVYFVKTTDNNLWKLVFIDFQGSGTGISTFQKTNLGLLSAIQNESSELLSLEVYPNPSNGPMDVLFSLPTANSSLRIALRDVQGRLLFEQNMESNGGLQALSIPDLALPQGLYLLSLQSPTGLLTKKIQIR